MSEVTIRNTDYLDRLDRLIEQVRTYYAEMENPPAAPIRHTNNFIPRGKNTEWYMSSDALDMYLEHSKDHDGMPQDYRALPLSVFRDKGSHWKQLEEEWRYDFPRQIGAHTCALMNYYPRDGLTGWHTNWNANAYQVLLTWSETGSGFFRYRTASGEIVTVDDTAGWSCRHFYFGKQDEPDAHCWHGCYTECERFTLAYKFCNDSLKSDNDILARRIRDDFLDEISTDPNYS
jgi:hypothetical protein